MKMQMSDDIILNMSNKSFLKIITAAAADSRLSKTAFFIQHGNTSCLLHCIAVAYYCYRLAERFKALKGHENELVRGALLHDYFLYDWHIPDKNRPLHGRYHPSAALKNAEEDFELSDMERDIIKKHMFPLTLTPPAYKESLLVCLVDKACSIYEIFSRKAYKNRQIRSAFEKIKNS